jgi:hypothetical protein
MATSSSEAPPGISRPRTVHEAALDRAVTGARSSHRVSFAAEELALFSDASHDRNPLHCSADYARRTPFGEPVVFGVLAALASLGRLRDRPHQSIDKLQVEFRDALAVGVDYQLELEESADRAKLTLADGRRSTSRPAFAAGRWPRRRRCEGRR